MRGDSLRDLYAKALALLGLGVLAGAGALVDYWPVSGPLPAIAGAPLTPALPRAISPAAVARVPVQAQVTEPRLAARVSRTRPVSHGASLVVTAAVAGDWALGGSVDLAPVDALAELAPTAAFSGLDTTDTPIVFTTDIPDESATVAEPPALAATDPADLFGEPSATRVVLAEAIDDAGEGLITGAFKRTGTSIVKTGARTGASIFDAVRIVSSMVRRALPTN